MALRGLSLDRLPKPFFGMRRVPFFTVGPQAALPARQIQSGEGSVVFATDFHVTTTEALRYAAFFGGMMNLPLHCLHVLPRQLEDGFQSQAIPLIITEPSRSAIGCATLGMETLRPV
jgi:hypothetical protein